MDETAKFILRDVLLPSVALLGVVDNVIIVATLRCRSNQLNSARSVFSGPVSTPQFRYLTILLGVLDAIISAYYVLFWLNPAFLVYGSFLYNVIYSAVNLAVSGSIWATVALSCHWFLRNTARGVCPSFVYIGSMLIIPIVTFVPSLLNAFEVLPMRMECTELYWYITAVLIPFVLLATFTVKNIRTKANTLDSKKTNDTISAILTSVLAVFYICHVNMVIWLLIALLVDVPKFGLIQFKFASRALGGLLRALSIASLAASKFLIYVWRDQGFRSMVFLCCYRKKSPDVNKLETSKDSE